MYSSRLSVFDWKLNLSELLMGHLRLETSIERLVLLPSFAAIQYNIIYIYIHIVA
jgi:hypothetical protein